MRKDLGGAFDLVGLSSPGFARAVEQMIKSPKMEMTILTKSRPPEEQQMLMRLAQIVAEAQEYTSGGTMNEVGDSMNRKIVEEIVDLTKMIGSKATTDQIKKMAIDLVVNEKKIVWLGEPDKDFHMTYSNAKRKFLVSVPTVFYPFFFKTADEAANFLVKSWAAGRPIDMDAGVPTNESVEEGKTFAAARRGTRKEKDDLSTAVATFRPDAYVEYSSAKESGEYVVGFRDSPKNRGDLNEELAGELKKAGWKTMVRSGGDLYVYTKESAKDHGEPITEMSWNFGGSDPDRSLSMAYTGIKLATYAMGRTIPGWDEVYKQLSQAMALIEKHVVPVRPGSILPPRNSRDVAVIIGAAGHGLRAAAAGYDEQGRFDGEAVRLALLARKAMVYVDQAVDLAMRMVRDAMESVELEEREDVVFDKPQWVADFKAGWEASKAARKYVPPQEAYNRPGVSRKHGGFWIDGYAAWIDYNRGAVGQDNVQVAKRLGLVESFPAPSWMNEAKPVGKAQAGLFDLATRSKGEWMALTDVTFRMIPVGFDKLTSGAEALSKKGLIDFDGRKFRLSGPKEPLTLAAQLAMAAQGGQSAALDELVAGRILEKIHDYTKFLEAVTGLKGWTAKVLAEDAIATFDHKETKSTVDLLWDGDLAYESRVDITVEATLLGGTKVKKFNRRPITAQGLAPDELFGFIKGMSPKGVSKSLGTMEAPVKYPKEYKQGFGAAKKHDGDPKAARAAGDVNPYKKDTNKFYAWNIGWNTFRPSTRS